MSRRLASSSSAPSGDLRAAVRTLAAARAGLLATDARSEQAKAAAQATDKESHAELKRLSRLPGNDTCADCGAPFPGWASLPHGVFVCIDCAQVHRHIGRHISQVKAINTGTYLWHEDEVEVMRRGGNALVNAVLLTAWDHSGTASPPLPPLRSPFGASSSGGPSARPGMPDMARYATAKYGRERWDATTAAAVAAMPVAPPVQARGAAAAPKVIPAAAAPAAPSFFLNFLDAPVAAPSAESSQPQEQSHELFRQEKSQHSAQVDGIMALFAGGAATAVAPAAGANTRLAATGPATALSNTAAPPATGGDDFFGAFGV